jgi:hypothetical protein
MAKAQWMRDQVEAYLKAASNGSTLSFVSTAMCQEILKAAADVNNMFKPATCATSAPSSVYAHNEEQLQTPYTVVAMPTYPIVARGCEAQDRHAVGAPAPSKLSDRLAPTTTDPHVQLLHHLALRGFVEEPVAGDGNCQFHALVDQLGQNGVGDGVDAMSLRLKAVQWLEENLERQMDDGSTGGISLLRHWIEIEESVVGHYLADMRDGLTWGDQHTLLAVSVLYGAEIVVMSSVSEDLVYIVRPPPTWGIPLRNRLYLGHYPELHYVSARKSFFSAAHKPAELRTAAPQRAATVRKLKRMPVAGAPGKGPAAPSAAQPAKNGKRPAAPSAAQPAKKHKGAQGSMSIKAFFKPV